MLHIKNENNEIIASFSKKKDAHDYLTDIGYSADVFCYGGYHTQLYMREIRETIKTAWGSVCQNIDTEEMYVEYTGIHKFLLNLFFTKWIPLNNI